MFRKIIDGETRNADKMPTRRIAQEKQLATLFFSYSHKDEALRDQLETQLAMLKRQGVIDTWHDRRIDAGQELHAQISSHVENDDIILLLVSPDFLASDYCYDQEMLRAMARHDAGEAIVIPVILRPSEGWTGAPFGKLNAVPADGKPITLSPDRDQAFVEVAGAIRKAAARLLPKPAPFTPAAPQMRSVAQPPSLSVPARQGFAPRSSNLRLAKTFSERDRDRFKDESFEYIARFFDTSLAELGARNPGIEGSFRRVDANRFTASIYRAGQAVSRCTIFIGSSMLRDGIAFAYGETNSNNSLNESLSVVADDQSMFLRSMGMASYSRQQDEAAKLSQEGAAELYWGLLIAPLQQGQR
ncbi:toll/interleukin-1 receptor domain-containing protein [Sphingomonas sp. R647]|uniref:toll/interleukin-1 receptor domain-containing protein n=1 Tax=Sphingomonas sp. R647 TaxID=2875233 RepID=UPI001CD7FE31|nr:toll/interleukin-1 receptor domain-containing protein [Sphingomonas sp. R647]MCA1197300.1 toll/interleukin-1 receptor domain-containing protein [Sphingomonas sp. R647]